MKPGGYLADSARITGLVYPISRMWQWGAGWFKDLVRLTVRDDRREAATSFATNDFWLPPSQKDAPMAWVGRPVRPAQVGVVGQL